MRVLEADDRSTRPSAHRPPSVLRSLSGSLLPLRHQQLLRPWYLSCQPGGSAALAASPPSIVLRCTPNQVVRFGTSMLPPPPSPAQQPHSAVTQAQARSSLAAPSTMPSSSQMTVAAVAPQGSNDTTIELAALSSLCQAPPPQNTAALPTLDSRNGTIEELPSLLQQQQQQGEQGEVSALSAEGMGVLEGPMSTTVLQQPTLEQSSGASMPSQTAIEQQQQQQQGHRSNRHQSYSWDGSALPAPYYQMAAATSAGAQQSHETMLPQQQQQQEHHLARYQYHTWDGSALPAPHYQMAAATSTEGVTHQQQLQQLQELWSSMGACLSSLTGSQGPSRASSEGTIRRQDQQEEGVEPSESAFKQRDGFARFLDAKRNLGSRLVSFLPQLEEVGTRTTWRKCELVKLSAAAEVHLLTNTIAQTCTGWLEVGHER